jgi:hypothetical protein
LLRWNIAGWVIAALLTGWLAMIQLHHFVIAYFAVISYGVIALGSWLTSDALRRLRPTKKQLAANQGPHLQRQFRFIQISVSGLIVLLAVSALALTLSEQHFFKLNQYKGILIPANEPDPQGPCDARGLSQSASMKVYAGRQEVITHGSSLAVVSWVREGMPNMILLGMHREKGDTVEVTANIIAEDGKSYIAQIDKNTFEVNGNQIFNSFSPPRPDLSTLALKDQQGNKLRIKLINQRSIEFQGRLYFKPGHFLEVNANGIRIGPNPSEAYGRVCWNITEADDAIMFGVK